MKRIIALLFFAQFISFTQTAQVKKSSDACPGSNKKNSTSSDYAYLSKRSATKDNSDFSKPKYQSIYTKKTVANTEVKRGKSSASVEKTVSAKAEKRVIEVPEEKNTPTVVEEKNTSSKSTREPEFEPTTPAGVKAEEEKSSEINKTETKIAPEPIVEKGKSPSSKKEKKSLETTKENKKQQRKQYIKKVKCEKNSATDCPKF